MTNGLTNGLEDYTSVELMDELLNRKAVEIVLAWRLKNNHSDSDVVLHYSPNMNRDTYDMFIDKIKEIYE